MNSYRLTARSLRDLERIRRRLTREANVAVANHVEDRLFNGFEELARLPWVGHRRIDVDDHTLLFYNVFEYVIAFRREPRIVVLRVVHGARDLTRIF